MKEYTYNFSTTTSIYIDRLEDIIDIYIDWMLNEILVFESNFIDRVDQNILIEVRYRQCGVTAVIRLYIIIPQVSRVGIVALALIMNSCQKRNVILVITY